MFQLFKNGTKGWSTHLKNSASQSTVRVLLDIERSVAIPTIICTTDCIESVNGSAQQSIINAIQYIADNECPEKIFDGLMQLSEISDDNMTEILTELFTPEVKRFILQNNVVARMQISPDFYKRIKDDSAPFEYNLLILTMQALANMYNFGLNQYATVKVS